MRICQGGGKTGSQAGNEIIGRKDNERIPRNGGESNTLEIAFLSKGYVKVHPTPLVSLPR